MQEGKFQKIFGTKAYACGSCVADESMTSLNLSKYPKLFPKSKYSQEGVDCVFYKDKLYKIIIPSAEINIDSYNKKHIKKYGSPTKKERWQNGISWVIWDDGVTTHSVSYVNRQGDEYPFNMPIGTVINIEYVDKALSQAVARDKKNDSH
jgi:hypothetical protein